MQDLLCCSCHREMLSVSAACAFLSRDVVYFPGVLFLLCHTAGCAAQGQHSTSVPSPCCLQLRQQLLPWACPLTHGTVGHLLGLILSAQRVQGKWQLLACLTRRWERKAGWDSKGWGTSVLAVLPRLLPVLLR